MFNITEFNLKTYIPITLFYTLVGLAFNQLFRKFPKLVFIGYIFSAMIFIPVSVIDWRVFDWVMWLKVYFLIPLVLLALWGRMRGLNSKMKTQLFFFLELNILLIAVRLFVEATLPNTINGITALLLMLTAPRSDSLSLQYLKGVKSPDLMWDAPYGWIFAYTAWEVAFVYSLFPDAIALQSFFLLAPLLVMWKERKLYMEARMSTLSFFLLVGMVVPPFRKPQMIENIETGFMATLVALFVLISFFFFKSNREKFGKFRSG